jgi:hypothetical protein
VSYKLVEAVLKKSKRSTYPDAPCLTVCCGRPHCGAVLGDIWRFTAAKDADLDDPESWGGELGSSPPIGTLAMIALADWSKAHFAEVEGGTHLQVWIAAHERGYCRLPNGDFQVLRRRDASREPNRVRQVPNPLTGRVLAERQEGRKQLPAEIAETVRYSRYSSRARDIQILGLEGRDQIGEFPVLPAVIICPECGQAPVKDERCRLLTNGATRNQLWPLAFDERSGT